MAGNTDLNTRVDREIDRVGGFRFLEFPDAVTAVLADTRADAVITHRACFAAAEAALAAAADKSRHLEMLIAGPQTV